MTVGVHVPCAMTLSVQADRLAGGDTVALEKARPRIPAVHEAQLVPAFERLAHERVVASLHARIGEPHREPCVARTAAERSLRSRDQAYSSMLSMVQVPGCCT